MLRWVFIWECLSHLHFTRQSCRAQILSPGALWGPSLPLSPWLALKSALYPDPGAEGLLPPLPPSGFTSFQPLHSVVSRLPPSRVLWRSSWILSAAEAAGHGVFRHQFHPPLWLSPVPARSPMVSAFLWGLCWLLLPLIFKSRSFRGV